MLTKVYFWNKLLSSGLSTFLAELASLHSPASPRSYSASSSESLPRSFLLNFTDTESPLPDLVVDPLLFGCSSSSLSHHTFPPSFSPDILHLRHCSLTLACLQLATTPGEEDTYSCIDLEGGAPCTPLLQAVRVPPRPQARTGPCSHILTCSVIWS